jgi:hypothetical protein
VLAFARLASYATVVAFSLGCGASSTRAAAVDEPYWANDMRRCEGGDDARCLGILREYAYGTGKSAPRDVARAGRYATRAHELRLSTRYWRSFMRGLDGKGSDADKLNAAFSVGFVSPMVFMGLFSVGPDHWDFSEVRYSDP